MARPSVSQRRAKQIIESSGGPRIRRGRSDRLEVGSGGLFVETGGTRTLRVGGTHSERIGGDHTTRAKRVEQTVRGHARISGRNDTLLLGGAMSDVHAGAELVLAGMSDDLVIGAGSRVTAVLDLWLAGVVGLEDKLATTSFDGAIVDTARTLYEREYATGVHNAGSASFSGAVYATQATGFRKLMKVSSGVRNLSAGGGGGSGGDEASSPGPSPPATTPDSADSGLLGSTRTPSPASGGTDSADLGRLASEASAAEDATTYRRTEDVSGATAELQEAARTQVAADSPEDAALAPSRTLSTENPSTGPPPASSADASPTDPHVNAAAPDRGAATVPEPTWAPSSTHERTYTTGQVRIGESVDEFQFDLVVGTRADKLLSDDAQASHDAAAFRILYDVKNDVTDMAHDTLRLADPRLKPGAVSDMTAVEARAYVAALHAGALQAGDTEEARRLQDLLTSLDDFAFDHYTAGLSQAEAAHDMTPLKLGSAVKVDGLEEHLMTLGQEQVALAFSDSASDAEKAEATKIGMLYMMAAQDTAQGLDPLAHIQVVLDSGLDQADAALYRQVASAITDFRAGPAAIGTAAAPVRRSLWTRAGDIASSLLAYVRPASRPGSGLAQAGAGSAAGSPIRFLDSTADVRVADAAPSLDASVLRPHSGPGPASRGAGPSSVRSAPGGPVLPPRAPGAGTDAASRVQPSLNRDGASWGPPTRAADAGAATSWSDQGPRS